jgi:hypothetical protein
MSIEAMARLPVFKGVAPEALAALIRLGALRDYPAHTLIPIRFDLAGYLNDVLWPPVEEGGVPNDLGLLIELIASFDDDLFELVEVFDELVCDGLSVEGPEVFAGLDLRAIGGLEDEVDPLGHDEVFGGMAWRAVEEEDDLFIWSNADFIGKALEGDAHQVGVHLGEEEPDDPPGLRVNETIDI